MGTLAAAKALAELPAGVWVWIDAGLLEMFLDAPDKSIPTFCAGHAKVTLANGDEEGFKSNMRKLMEQFRCNLPPVELTPFGFHAPSTTREAGKINVYPR